MDELGKSYIPRPSEDELIDSDPSPELWTQEEKADLLSHLNQWSYAPMMDRPKLEQMEHLSLEIRDLIMASLGKDDPDFRALAAEVRKKYPDKGFAEITREWSAAYLSVINRHLPRLLSPVYSPYNNDLTLIVPGFKGQLEAIQSRNERDVARQEIKWKHRYVLGQPRSDAEQLFGIAFTLFGREISGQLSQLRAAGRPGDIDYYQRIFQTLNSENQNTSWFWTVAPFAFRQLLHTGADPKDAMEKIINWAAGTSGPNAQTTTLIGLEILNEPEFKNKSTYLQPSINDEPLATMYPGSLIGDPRGSYKAAELMGEKVASALLEPNKATE